MENMYLVPTKKGKIPLWMYFCETQKTNDYIIGFNYVLNRRTDISVSPANDSEESRGLNQQATRIFIGIANLSLPLKNETRKKAETVAKMIATETISNQYSDISKLIPLSEEEWTNIFLRKYEKEFPKLKKEEITLMTDICGIDIENFLYKK
jgi:hypothetical protein